jgi:hypothetical protein
MRDVKCTKRPYKLMPERGIEVMSLRGSTHQSEIEVRRAICRQLTLDQVPVLEVKFEPT